MGGRSIMTRYRYDGDNAKQRRYTVINALFRVTGQAVKLLWILWSGAWKME
jgi:hypothetical protein